MKPVREVFQHTLRYMWPVLVITATILATFATTLFIHSRSFYLFPDNIDQFYAWYQKLAHVVHQGGLPIWDANVSAGHSFVGELQAGVFYPINIIWVALFGSLHGIGISWLELLVVFHFWLAAVGMYSASRSMNLGKVGSIAAALVFAVGGGVAVRSVSQTAIFFGICLMPWAFFGFNRWLVNGRKVNLVLCAIAMGFMILAGHIDPWYFSCLLLVCLIVCNPVGRDLRAWFHVAAKQLGAVALVVVASLVIASPQVFLSAQYLPHAVRFVGDSQPIGPNDKVSVLTYTKFYSFKLDNFLSLIDPVQYPVIDGNEIYVGITGLGIVLGAVLLFRRQLQSQKTWQKYGRFLLSASVVAGVIMIGYWTFIPLALRELPLVSQVRQLARYAVIIQFCLAILVGICLEVVASHAPSLLAKRKKHMTPAYRAALVLCGFLGINALYLFMAATKFGTVDRHFFYQNAIVFTALAAILLIRSRMQYILLAAIVLSTITQPVWFMPKIANLAASYPPHYYEQTPGIIYLEQFYGQARVDIEDNALPPNIGDIYPIQTMNGYGATLHQYFYQYLNEPDTSGDMGLHLDLLNVRFIVTTKDHPELVKVFTDTVRGVSIYERPNYVPRAYFLDETTVCRMQKELCSPIRIMSYGDGYIKLHYDLSRPDTMVLSEVNYVGWRAYVDGKMVPIASYGPYTVKLFRSVAVPAGQHTVEFKYMPFALR